MVGSWLRLGKSEMGLGGWLGGVSKCAIISLHFFAWFGACIEQNSRSLQLQRGVLGSQSEDTRHHQSAHRAEAVSLS